MTKELLIKLIEEGQAREISQLGLELKASWEERYGKDLSAIANSPDQIKLGWLVVGVSDDGKLCGRDENWAAKTEESIANQLREWLSPSWAVTLSGHKSTKGYFLILEVKNPDDLVTWKNRPYKLIGTTSSEMGADEALIFAQKFAGSDFSKTEYVGKVEGALVLEYAAKLLEAGFDGVEHDLNSVTPKDVLSKLGLMDKKAAGILFGDYKARIVHFDENGDVLDQKELKGLYNILSDRFVEEIQSWTRRQGTVVPGATAAAHEELPYPPRVIREVLSNAVAHASFNIDGGDILIEMHPGRLVVRNTAPIEAKAFANKWFSNGYHTHNILLTTALRLAKFSDNVGSGKTRIFRQLLEEGKREPLVEFSEHGKYGRWVITIYNEETDSNMQALQQRLAGYFSNREEWRIACALILWRGKKFPEILEHLDEHHKQVTRKVLANPFSPVSFYGKEDLFVKRWVSVALTGKDSKRFTVAEEADYLDFLKRISFLGSRKGLLTTEEVRGLIGLSHTASERTQLSNLFTKWRKQGLVKQEKRGQWRFLQEAEQIQILFRDYITLFSKPIQNK